MKLTAVIDMGSNSFILLIGEKDNVIEEVVCEVGLKGINSRSKAVELGRKALQNMVRRARDAECSVYVFGTALFREDPDLFYQITVGLNVNSTILTQEEEAMYSYLSVDDSLSCSKMTVIDLGGGSLEVVTSKGFKGFQLGTHILNSLFDLSLPGARDFDKAVTHTKNVLCKSVRKDSFLVGIGGSFVAIAAFFLEKWDLRAVDGFLLRKNHVDTVISTLREMSYEKLRSLKFLPKGRERTLAAGCVVARVLTDLCGEIKISSKGYRYAVLKDITSNGKLTYPWRARGDLNSRPPDPQSSALSS